MTDSTTAPTTVHFTSIATAYPDTLFALDFEGRIWKHESTTRSTGLWTLLPSPLEPNE